MASGRWTGSGATLGLIGMLIMSLLTKLRDCFISNTKFVVLATCIQFHGYFQAIHRLSEDLSFQVRGVVRKLVNAFIGMPSEAYSHYTQFVEFSLEDEQTQPKYSFTTNTEANIRSHRRLIPKHRTCAS